MKKFICFILFLLFSLSLSSCVWHLPVYDTVNSPEIEYETEVLYSEETPCEDICWSVELRSPYPKNDEEYYKFYADVGAGGIFKREKSEAEKTGYEKFLLKKMKMSRSSFKRKYGLFPTVYEQDCFFYEDRTIFVIHGATSEEIENGNRMRTILIEEHNGKIYTHYFDEPYTSEEYRAFADRCNVEGFPNGNGRIGDIFYLRYRYYDLDTHEMKYYNGNTREHSSYADPRTAYTSLCEQPISAKYFCADGYESKYDVPNKGLSGAEIRGRKYFLFTTNNSAYIENENGEEKFRGNELYFVMTDAQTDRVLYIQRFYLKNYAAQTAPNYQAPLYIRKNGKLYFCYN